MSDSFEQETKTRLWLSQYYEIAGAAIVTIAVFLFLIYTILLYSPGNPRELNSNSVIVAAPKTGVFNYTNYDSAIFVLASQNADLLDSISKLKIKIENVRVGNDVSETKLKSIASIVSIVIAIVGFFGFKSLNDIRENSLRNAQLDAKEAAKKITNEYLETFRAMEQERRSYYEGYARNNTENISNIFRRLEHIERAFGVPPPGNDQVNAGQDNGPVPGRGDNVYRDEL